MSTTGASNMLRVPPLPHLRQHHDGIVLEVRGTVGARWKQRESLRTLGLKKIRQSVVREDNPQTRGLIQVVHHLVEVEEV